MDDNRINTLKVLNNRYFNGGGDIEGFTTNSISVSPYMSKQYDYATTDDIVLLNDRKDTAEKIYNIFKKSPYYEKYNREGKTKKIIKEDIFPLFYYIKEELEKEKKITTFEYIIAVCEFFEFNYDYIVNKVLSNKLRFELLEDYYNNMGMKDRMDKESSNRLF